MPKQTFFNLPSEKRETLIHAAKKEFSRAAFAEASIANIVKEANIPRGSFYQYFEDKADVYHYLLQEISLYRQRTFVDSLKKYDGDLFQALAQSFEGLIKELENEKESEQFYRNVFINMDYRSGNHFFGSLDMQALSKHYDEIKQYVRKDKLNITNDEELVFMMQIMMSIFIKTIVNKYVQKIPLEQVIEQFQIQLNLVRNGFERKDV